MITFSDEQILETTKILTLAQKCVDVFIDSFTVDRDLSSDISVRGFWGAGQYDKDKVRAFYTSKESKFRKNIKKADKNLKVSVWKDFAGNIRDLMTYNFYYNNKIIFRLELIFSGKSIDYNTYKGIYYDIKTENELIMKSTDRKMLKL